MAENEGFNGTVYRLMLWIIIHWKTLIRSKIDLEPFFIIHRILSKDVEWKLVHTMLVFKIYFSYFGRVRPCCKLKIWWRFNKTSGDVEGEKWRKVLLMSLIAAMSLMNQNVVNAFFAKKAQKIVGKDEA